MISVVMMVLVISVMDDDVDDLRSGDDLCSCQLAMVVMKVLGLTVMVVNLAMLVEM